MAKICELFFVFFKIGFLAFGGGYVMFLLAKKETVDKKGWATEQDLIDYYAIGTFTPGIIAVNVATLIGYKVAGKVGGIVATLGLILPSFIMVTLISIFLKEYMTNPYFVSALSGIKIFVVALLAKFLLDMARPEAKKYKSIIIFSVACTLIFLFNLHIVFVVIISGLLGYFFNFPWEKKK